MASSALPIGQLVTHTGRLLARRAVLVSTGVLIGAAVVSIMLAPDRDASVWEWTRLLVAASCGALALIALVAALAIDGTDVERRSGLAIAGALVIAGLLLSLTFSFATALLFSVGLSVVATVIATTQHDRPTWSTTGTLLIVVPWWVWTALGAWTWELLALLPVAAISLISDGHIRASIALPETVATPLSSRGHYLAGWLGVLGAAVILLVIGLLAGVSITAVITGIVGALLLLAIDMSPASLAREIKRPVVLIDVALIWLALCWIVSL